MSDFRQAYVGTSFIDALERLQENSLNEDFPKLKQITGRDDNLITADELDAALNSPIDSTQRFATILKESNHLFLLDVCKEECRRRTSNGTDVGGVGTHFSVSRNGRMPAHFKRRVGNDHNPCNSNDPDVHRCPTPHAGGAAYRLQDTSPDGKNFYLRDSFEIELERGSAKISRHKSKVVRAPAHVSPDDRAESVEMFESPFVHADFTDDGLGIFRTQGYPDEEATGHPNNKRRVDIEGTDDGTFALRAFNPNSKECRFFISDGPAQAINHDLSRVWLNEHSINDFGGASHGRLPVDIGSSLLLWIPKNRQPAPPAGALDFIENTPRVHLINEETDFASRYHGWFVFFERASDLKRHLDNFFSPFEAEMILSRRARPNLHGRVDWLDLTWHASNTPSLYPGNDSLRVPYPSLVASDGKVHLLLTKKADNRVGLEDAVKIKIKREGMQDCIFSVRMNRGRAWMSIHLPRNGTYVVSILDGKKSRYLFVTKDDEAHTVSDFPNILLQPENHAMEPMWAPPRPLGAYRTCVSEEIRNQILQQIIDLLDAPIREGLRWLQDHHASAEHAYAEITRLTFHEHSSTWMRKRNQVFGMASHLFDPFIEAWGEHRSHGAYITQDLVSFRPRTRENTEDKLQWETLEDELQCFPYGEEWRILHSAKSNPQLVREYGEDIVRIDSQTGIRFLRLSDDELSDLCVHHNHPRLSERLYHTPQTWIQALHDAAEHGEDGREVQGGIPNRVTHPDQYHARWAGAGDFNATSIGNKLRERWEGDLILLEPERDGWINANHSAEALYFEVEDRLYFLHLVAARQLHDDRIPWRLYLGWIDAGQAFEERGVIIAHGTPRGTTRAELIDPVGQSYNGKMSIPWYRFPRRNGAGDSNYLIRETLRAFSASIEPLDEGDLVLARRGLPSGVFSLPPERNNGDHCFSPFSLNTDWVFEAAQRCGIVHHDTTQDQFRSVQKQIMLEQWWWTYED